MTRKSETNSAETSIERDPVSFRSTNGSGESLPMLYWTIVFIVVAVIAELLGLSGVAGEAAWIAHVLFVIFLVLFIVSLIFRGRPPAV